MDAQLKKRSIYFVLILAFGMATYKTFTEYKPVVQSARYTDYLEGSKNKVNATKKNIFSSFMINFVGCINL